MVLFCVSAHSNMPKNQIKINLKNFPNGHLVADLMTRPKVRVGPIHNMSIEA